MKSFIEQAQGYVAYHENQTTRYTHMVGTPLILFSLMILLGFVHVVIVGVLEVSLANIAGLVLLLFYFRLNWRLALVLTPIFIFLLWIATFFSRHGPTSFGLWSFILIFLIGIVLQFTGHLLEEKRPTLVDNLWHVFIAPLLIVAEPFFMMERMSKLKEDIYGKQRVTIHNTTL